MEKISRSPRTFAQTSLVCVIHSARNCLPYLLATVGREIRMILCHMLELLVHSNASTCQRSLRLPLLGEGRQGAEQMGGPQRCPTRRRGQRRWCGICLSLPGLFHSVQCPLLHSWGCKQMVGFLFKSRINILVCCHSLSFNLQIWLFSFLLFWVLQQCSWGGRWLLEIFISAYQSLS